MRLTPDGVEVFGDTQRRFIEAPLGTSTRETVIDALWEAIREARAPAQTGRWGRASLEVCHAILRSAESGETVALTRQCGLTDQETTT